MVTLLIAWVDGYHSWLYAKVLLHANNIEAILRYYYVYLARGDVDPQAWIDFQSKIQAHRFGKFIEIRKGFTFSDLKYARPRLLIVVLYSALLASAAVSGGLAYWSSKRPAPSFGCASIPGSSDTYVCKPK